MNYMFCDNNNNNNQIFNINRIKRKCFGNWKEKKLNPQQRAATVTTTTFYTFPFYVTKSSENLKHL